MKGLSSLALLVVTGAMTFAPAPAEAKIYKCVGGDGAISYSQSPCASDTKVSKVLQGKSVKERFDCRVTRAFSKSVVQEMKAGVSKQELFAQYGGAGSLKATTVSVIKYIYGLENDSDATANSIVALSGARCEAGIYGQATDCPDFPASYLEKMGGCAAVKGAPIRVQVSDSSEPDLGEALPDGTPVDNFSGIPDSDVVVDAGTLTQKNYTVLKTTAAEKQSQCRTQILQEIDEIKTQMRQRITLDDRNDLNDKRFDLRQNFGEC